MQEQPKGQQYKEQRSHHVGPHVHGLIVQRKDTTKTHLERVPRSVTTNQVRIVTHVSRDLVDAVKGKSL